MHSDCKRMASVDTAVWQDWHYMGRVDKVKVFNSFLIYFASGLYSAHHLGPIF